MGDVNVALNAFGFNLIQKLQKDAEKGKSKSCVISPFSLGMAIAAAAEGAAKDTLQGILKALNLEELNLRDFDILRKDLEKGNEKYLTVANGLFYDREFGILKSYIEDVEDYLNVHVEELSKDRAAEKVNSWVAKATKDKITRIIDDASKSRLLLVNAIHFKADWENPFDERNTQSGTFTRSDGSSFKCQMMHQTGEFQYQESDDFQAVSLLYRNKFRAVVVLPRKHSSSSTVLEHISKDWKNFPKDFKSSDGKLSLPRFQVEWKSELNNALSDLGMSAAFDQMAADFSKACDVKGLYISAVLHKTYLDVNERGTEAAAASAVDERSRSRSPPRGFTMNVDHTFIFILWDKTTDQILFTGVIDDFSESPSKSENNGNSRGRKRSPSPSPEKRRRSPSPRRRSPSPRRSPSHGGRPPRFGSESDRSNSACLFVGNLPVYYREGEVRDMFEKFGKIRSLMLSMNKERVAYAFVEFDSRSDAEDALKWADGHVVDKDYKLRVDWDVGRDKKRSQRPYRRGGFRGRSSYRGYGRRRDSRSPRRSYSRSRSRSPRRKRSRSPRRYSRSPRRRSPSRSRSPSPKRR